MKIVSRIGILALQGCIQPHVIHLKKLGAEPVLVRSANDLQNIERLILPGGESTAMLKLINRERGFFEALQEFCSIQPTWGICAGAILLASQVTNPIQQSLSLLPVRAERNSYGSQLDSFKSEIEIPIIGGKMKVDFIRAPRLRSLDSSVQVLACYKKDQVFLGKDHLLCSSFHVEFGDDQRLYQFFLERSAFSDKSSIRAYS